MTARNLYNAVLIELNKENAPNILLEDFNYFANKAINNYINKRYNIYDISQQTTDDLRVLKSSAILKPKHVEAYEGFTTLGVSRMATYEAILPSDYLHLLNCICVYKVKKTYDCYNRGQSCVFPAKRLTADMYSQVVNNYWNRPTYKNPYYYIHNVNKIDTQLEENYPLGEHDENDNIREKFSTYTYENSPTNPYRLDIPHKTQSSSIPSIIGSSFELDIVVTENEETISTLRDYIYDKESDEIKVLIYSQDEGNSGHFFTIMYIKNNKIWKFDTAQSQIENEPNPQDWSDLTIWGYDDLDPLNPPTFENLTINEKFLVKTIQNYELTKENTSLHSLLQPSSSEDYPINGVDSPRENIKVQDTSVEYGEDGNGNIIVQGFGLPKGIKIGEDYVSNVERGASLRYGNVSEVRLEIRYGTDNKVFELVSVYVDYIKAPQNIRLTQIEIDQTEDTSQMLEYPDYVCQEIINELVHLIMENISDQRLQTHPVVSQSIANPAQAQTPEAAG